MNICLLRRTNSKLIELDLRDNVAQKFGRAIGRRVRENLVCINYINRAYLINAKRAVRVCVKL